MHIYNSYVLFNVYICRMNYEQQQAYLQSLVATGDSDDEHVEDEAFDNDDSDDEWLPKRVRTSNLLQVNLLCNTEVVGRFCLAIY